MSDENSVPQSPQEHRKFLEEQKAQLNEHKATDVMVNLRIPTKSTVEAHIREAAQMEREALGAVVSLEANDYLSGKDSAAMFKNILAKYMLAQRDIGRMIQEHYDSITRLLMKMEQIEWGRQLITGELVRTEQNAQADIEAQKAYDEEMEQNRLDEELKEAKKIEDREAIEKARLAKKKAEEEKAQKEKEEKGKKKKDRKLHKG